MRNLNPESSISMKSISLSLGRGHWKDDKKFVLTFEGTASKQSYLSTSNGHKTTSVSRHVESLVVEHEARSLSIDVPANTNVSLHDIASEWTVESIDQTAMFWELSSSDRERLIELGLRLRGINFSSKNKPADVVRFYIANSGDIDRAEKQFRKMVAWRMHNEVDQILTNYHPPEDLVNYYPGAVLKGLDKVGDPIFVSRIGVTDGAGMLKRYGHNEMIKHAIWLRELLCTGDWMQQYEKANGRPVKGAIVIEDVDHLQLFQIVSNPHLLSLYSEIMRLDQDNYPEAAKTIIILRAPTLFRIVWNIVQHFFDANVRSKMVFTSRSNYLEVLAEYLDVSVLPHCVVPGIGKGEALPGMPQNFHGGKLPISSSK
jgi:CRAL/TRIO domain